jgi:hypothetical protein
MILTLDYQTAITLAGIEVIRGPLKKYPLL